MKKSIRSRRAKHNLKHKRTKQRLRFSLFGAKFKRVARMWRWPV